MCDPDDSGADSREEMVDAAIAEYLRAAGGSEPFEVDKWLARYPALVDELAEFLRNEGVFGRLAAPFHPPSNRTHTDHPNVTPTADEPESDLVGCSFGDYEILGKIAAGGMGVVFRAQQRSLNRVVALKMVRGKRPSHKETEDLRREAAAVAGLDHPHIVPLYEIGEHDGRPYFAMKLFGGSLAARVGSLVGCHRAAATLVATVAQAVEHAHRRGILHRDLKPSNILLDDIGTPHVTDFGLARRLEGGSGTSSLEAVAGTPSYMAPEQARGEKLTTAVDVYGLGAVLYALLTGGPPFRAGSGGETLLLVMTADPVAPRAVDPKVPRDLEAICLKCLAKEPAERYTGAAEVADDLKRWLKGEPVLARPAGAVRRAVKWVRRNRITAALAAVTGLLLLSAIGVAWWRQTENLRQQIADEKQAGEERERLAEERARQARNAEAAVASVGECERALAAGRADRAAPALADADRRMPEGGADELRERVERCRADLEILRALNQVDTFRWTPVKNKLPGYQKVAEQRQAAFKKFGVVPGETPVEDAARRVADSLVRDRLLIALHQWLASEPSPGVRRLLSLVDPNDYRESFRETLANGNGDRVRELATRADALAQPPWFAAVLGQEPDVPVSRRREVLEAAVRAHPGDLDLLMELGNLDPIDQREGAGRRVRWYQAAVAAHPECRAALNNLGLALGDMGDYDGAIACYREAIRLDSGYARAHNNLGRAILAKGDLDAALASFEIAVHLDPMFAEANSNLGLMLLAKRRVDRAIVYLKAALRLDPTFARAHNNLGEALLAKGDLDAARACFEEALRLDPMLASAYDNLGLALKDKNPDGAIAYFKAALLLDPRFASVHKHLGVALYKKGDLEAAVACFEQAIRLDPKNADAHYNLGVTLEKKGDLDGAVASFKEAIRLDPKDAPAHYSLGVALYKKGDLDGAVASFENAVLSDPKLTDALNNLGKALHDKGELDKASACFKGVIRRDEKYALAYYNLGLILHDKEDLDAAIACFGDAIRLDPKLGAAHHHLGLALMDKGDLDAAIAAFKNASLLEKNNRSRSARFLAERWQALLPQLPDVIAGRTQLTSPMRACEFAVLCGKPFQRRYAAGVMLYSAAFEVEPKWAPTFRYDAARQAVLASAGRDADFVAFGVEEWGELIDRARTWLRADLRSWAELAKNPEARRAVRANLVRWKWDLALAPVRDPAWLAAMAPADRKAWEAFWADVDTALAALAPATADRGSVKP